MASKLFSDQIREAIDASGMSRYAICKAIRLDKGYMSRFMAGRVGLSMEKLDGLCRLLNLRIVRDKTSKVKP